MVRTLPLALLPAAGFVALASHLGAGSPLQARDEAFTRAVGEHTPAFVHTACGWLTHLGDPPVLWAIGAVVALWLLMHAHRELMVVWIAALLGNGLLTRLLKAVFERARPLIDGLPGPAHGYSFPSGHSSASLVAYGMLAYLAWRLAEPSRRWPLAIAAGLIVFCVACSRIVLQVHYASDVLGGLCVGLAWMLACTGTAQWLRTRLGQGRAGSAFAKNDSSRIG